MFNLEQKELFPNYSEMPATFLIDCGKRGNRLWFNPCKVESISAEFGSPADHAQDCISIAKSFWQKGEPVPGAVQETIVSRLQAYAIEALNIHEIMAVAFHKYWVETELDLSWLDD